MPFTIEQFYAVFREYNHAVWPAQYALFALGCFAVYVAALPSRTYDRVASGMLAFLWLWAALAYHAAFFSKVNPAAFVFALAFLAQAGLLWWYGVARGRLELHLRNDLPGWIGSAAILYALLVYPILTAFYGHVFPEAPTFGVPCPTTIFTIGLLLWAQRPYPHWLLVIPALWAAVATVAAASLGMPPDYGLTAVAIAALGIVLGRVAREHALHLPVLRL